MSTGDKYITAHANADASLVIARLTAENAKLAEINEKACALGLRLVDALREIRDHDGYTMAGLLLAESMRMIARRALADADTGEWRGGVWIACSERMPASGTVALIWSPYGNHFRVCRSTGSDWYVDGHGRNAGDFTHWRPLPTPPRADDEKETR